MGALPRRRPEPLELPLSPTLELLPEPLEPDDVDDEPPEEEDDPEDDEPDGEAVPADGAPAGAECCAFAAGGAPTAMTPMRLAARRYRFMPSSTL
jgi:hypothetical protein